MKLTIDNVKTIFLMQILEMQQKCLMCPLEGDARGA